MAILDLRLLSREKVVVLDEQCHISVQARLYDDALPLDAHEAVRHHRLLAPGAPKDTPVDDLDLEYLHEVIPLDA